MSNVLEGFSKKNKEEKLEVIGNFLKTKQKSSGILKVFITRTKPSRN